MKRPIITTIKRALSISKTYPAIAVVFIIIALVAWNPAIYAKKISTTNLTNSSPSNAIAANTAANAVSSSAHISSGIPFLALPLFVVPAFMLVTPLLMLFVYDKNNGVLEYMLSLGMTQVDIYMQYLKAALLLGLVYLAIFLPLYFAYSSVVYGSTFMALLPIPVLLIPFTLAVVTFMTICMMAFSTLQKARAGSNQPLGMIVGWLSTVPAYAASIIFSFSNAAYADSAIIAAIAIASFAILAYSGKLISREKLLP